MKRTYTKDEAMTIVAGLLEGAKKHRPVSEAAWRARFAPPTYEDKMLGIMQEIRDELAYKNDRPEPRKTPTVFQPPAPSDHKITPI